MKIRKKKKKKKDKFMKLDFEKIGNILVLLLPEKWEKVKMFCQVAPENYEFFFYVKLNGAYIQNYALEDTHDVSREEMRNSFREIYNLMKDSQQQDNWKVATFKMDSSGGFNFELDYDIEEVDFEYKEKWLKKYIK